MFKREAQNNPLGYILYLLFISLFSWLYKVHINALTSKQTFIGLYIEHFITGKMCTQKSGNHYSKAWTD